ncbi:MAG TPA: hypothetical protein VGM90_28350 [Kofleriaceae bacterium]
MRKTIVIGLLLTSVLASVSACGKKKGSDPATCAVAGEMVAKRLGEFADQAKVTGEKRTTLDAEMAKAITTRCTEDKWDDVPLGCLGAIHAVPEGKLDVDAYRKGVDVCTDAIGTENHKKLDASVGDVIKSTMAK